MIKNEVVTKSPLEANEWEGELDDADLAAVGGAGLPIVGDIIRSLPVVGDLVKGLPVVGSLLVGQ